MNASSTFSRGEDHSSDNSSNSTASKPTADCGGCCKIDIRIDAYGDVNIYNCSISAGTVTTSPPSCESGFSSAGTCLPAVPGAKHKLSREQKFKQVGRWRSRAELARCRGDAIGATVPPWKDSGEGGGIGPLSPVWGQLPRGLLSCPVAASILFRNM